MNWSEKRLKNFFKEYCPHAIFVVVVGAVFFLSLSYFQEPFVWKDVKLLPEPDLSMRMLSAMVFDSIGWALYELGFYSGLHFVVVKSLGSWWLYKRIKRLIWYSLMFFMGFYVAPWIINFLNGVLSFFINLFALVLHLSPSIGVSLALALLANFWARRHLMKPERKKLVWAG